MTVRQLLHRYWHWVALVTVLAGLGALLGAIPTAAEPMASANLQVAHLAPFAMDPGTSVTVTLNGTDVLTNVEFADSTGYLSVPSGSTMVQIFAGSSATPAISATVFLTDAMDFTAVAVGGANAWPLDLKLLVDDNSAPTSGSAKVRIGHLAPFAAGPPNTLADVRLQDGTILTGFDDVPYDTIANYIELPADSYDLKITSADGSVTLIDPMPVTLNDGDIVSVFAVGDGTNQPVGVFALPSSVAGSLLPLAANLQLAHLAPFAMDPGTAVDVKLNGTDVLTDVEFTDSTGYLPVPSGMNMVQIFPVGSATPAISATVFMTHATDFTAVAVGGANMWPLDLKLLVDDNSVPTSGFAKVRIGHLAPFADGLSNTLADVRLQNGTILPGFDDVPYGTIADYIELPAITQDLKITSSDGSVTLIDPMPVTLNDGDILSIFAVGDGANQPLGVFALPAGMSGSLLPLTPRLQLAHLAPFDMDPGTAVTVTLNGTDILTDVEFADSTGYMWVPEGDNMVQIFPGSATSPAISATVYLTQSTDFTAIAVGGANMWPLDLKLLVDDNTSPMPGFAKVRVGHIAPFASGLANTLADVRLQDGTVIVDNVPYGLIGGYTPLPADTYDLKITSADGSVTLIDPLPVDLNDGDIVSVFAVGDGANQPVGAFALPPGTPGSLLPLAASLQLAHLAPFAMDPGTSVTVTLNGTDVLTNVEFADSTGYLPVPAGMNMVQIFPTGSASPAISATVYLTHAVDFTAIAVGGANMWPLDLELLVDDNTPPPSGNAKVRIGHLAPFADGLANTVADVRLQDDTVIVDDVPYGTIADHTPLPAGMYDLKITSSDGITTLIDPFPVMLNDGDILSVFAVGDGANQPLGVFALPSGAPGALLPLSPQILYMPIIYKDAP